MQQEQTAAPMAAFDPGSAMLDEDSPKALGLALPTGGEFKSAPSSTQGAFDPASAVEIEEAEDGGLLTDTGNLLGAGVTRAAQNVRELVGRIPLVGEGLVEAGDAADRFLSGKDSETLLRENAENYQQSLSPEMQGAQQKLWWDDETNSLGPAWTDPRAYASGIIQSLPEMAISMGAAGRLAKGAYARVLAKTGDKAAAATAAARTATLAGGATEGLLGGADTARQVRDEITAMPVEQLMQSEAFQSLLDEGLQLEEARTQLAEDSATQGLLIAGAATGVFGGMGDRALANMLTGKVTAGIVGRTAKGAIGEGVLEELPQSIGQKLAENYVMQEADPERELGEGALNEGLGGLATGAAMGGGLGAVASPRVEPATVADPAAGHAPDAGVAVQDVPEPTTSQLAGLSIAELQARAAPEVEASVAAEPAMPQGADGVGEFRAEDASEQIPGSGLEQAELAAPEVSEAAGEISQPADDFEYITRASGEPFQAHGAAKASQAFREAKKAGRNPTVAKVEGGFAVRVPADPKRYQMRPIDQAAHEAATSPSNDLPAPTPAQIEAGNYKKGHVRVHGLDISIENPRGSERSGTGPDGTPWRRTMSDHYGYLKRTTGADGEGVDVYVGPQPDSDQVFVVDQLNQQDGGFDEQKVMLGYPDQEAAVAAYRSNFDDGWKVGPVTAMPVDQFKAWLKTGDLSAPLAQQAAAPADAAQPAPANPAEAAAFLDPAEAQYSRGRDSKPEGPGLSAQEAQRVADEFLAEFKGNVPLKLRVVGQQEEAYGPNGSRERIGVVKGAYHAASGQLVLAAANQLDASDARQTLRHEIVGHYGLNTFKPAEKRALLDRILATEQERSLKSAWEHVRRNYAEAPRDYQAEELFAYLAEQERPPVGAAWEKLLAALQRALRATGLSDRPLTRAELRDMARSIARGIRSGERTQQTFPKTDQDQFRRDGDGPALSREAIESALAASPELAGVKVVQSFDDLPLSVRIVTKRDGVSPADVRGVFRADGQYLVADNLLDLEDAVRTAVHEMVGHRGIHGLLGEQLSQTMERIYSSEMARPTGKQRIAQIREAYAKVLRGKTPEQQRQLIAEEIIANLAENGDRPSLVQSVVSKIRGLLRKLFPKVKWTYNDVLGLIEQSRQWLRTQQAAPGKAGGKPRYSLSAAAEQTAEPDAAESETVAIPEESHARRLQRRYQDSLNRFTVIKEWMAAQGKELSEDADVYLAEERMHSRFANKAKDFREQTVRPLVEQIQKAGFSMEEVAQYLHAQHAGERNAQVAKVNKALPDGGSGMSNAEAAQILAAASPRLAALANQFREITDRTRQVLLDSGLIDKEAAAAWQKAYQHYVPLKGGPNEKAAKTGNGKGLSLKHKTKRALGHSVREEGEWIIENIIADHERALMAAEKNLVGQHLLKMALEVGIDDIMTIGKPEKRAVLRDQASYEVIYKGQPIGAFASLEAARTFKAMAPVTMAKSKLSDFTIRKTSDPSVAYMASPLPAPNEALVYVDGHAVRIQINDDLLARAYNGMGVDALGTFFASARALNRLFSAMYTGYNPEFLVKNVVRDFTTGLANVTGEEGAVFAAKAAKNYFSSFGALLRYAFTGKADKWIRQYRADGGNTGAAYLSDLERLGADVQAEYDAYQSVRNNLRKGSLRGAARAAGRRAFNLTLRHIEALNEAGENAMRLALYRTAVEQGKTRNRAASLAKNTTVNFNRKGELGAQANALYLFFNAGVQGTASIAHAHFKGKYKGQAWGLSSAMAALGYSLALLAAGADEDEYDEIPEHVKARNLVLLNPVTGKQATIPVPYGYGFFFSLGRGMADAQRTGQADELPWRLASSFIGEFSPFGSMVAGEEPDMAQAALFASPTLGQIPLSIAFNRTSFGGPMRPENPFKEHEPDRLKMWRGTEGTWADELAGAMAAVGFDVSPETLKYLNRTFTGGAGNFIGTTFDAGLLGWQGATLETKEIPFLRGFYRENGVADARARFWRYKAKAGKAAEELDRAIDEGDRQRVGAVLKENRELIIMDAIAKDFSEAAGAVRDRVQRVRLGDLSVAEKRAQIKKIEEQEAALYDRFAKIFRDKTRKKE